MPNKTTIKGDIVLADRVLMNGFISFADGKITSISESIEENREFIDATDKYILPRAIDAHVHCYSALEEGFEAATTSAVACGVTTIVEMPYDADNLICTKELFS